MTLIEAIRLFLGYAGNLQEKVVHHSHNTHKTVRQESFLKRGINSRECKTGTVIPVMFVFVEGPGAGWILAAEHPAAVSTNPVSALQRSHSHTAPGEGRSHSSRHIHTLTGAKTFLLKTDCCSSFLSTAIHRG